MHNSGFGRPTNDANYRLRFLWTVRADAFTFLVILILGIVVSCWGLGTTGVLWPDSPIYLNGALMYRDWLMFGDLTKPFEFAVKQYSQYPAFHVPFHPPAYPGLMSIWFLVVGTSYESARVFVGILFAIGGIFFYLILREFELEKPLSLLATLIMMSLPEISLWSRDTMSEIPALSFQFAATFAFLRWTKLGTWITCIAAFAFAEAAFMSRVSSSGIILIWILYLVIEYKRQLLFSVKFVICGAAFGVLNVSWVVFVSRFARFELGGDSAKSFDFGGFIHSLSDSLLFYSRHLPEMAGGFTLIALLAGIGAIAFTRIRHPLLSLAIAWFAGSSSLLIAMGLVPEIRYFLNVLPSLALLTAAVFVASRVNKILYGAVAVSACLLIGLNINKSNDFPTGLIGYEPVAHYLAKNPEPGNVLSVTWMSQDLIFRYQANNPQVNRDIIRGDRTLAIRVSGYGGASGGLNIPPIMIAKNDEQFLDVVRKGRVRFVVTYLSRDIATKTYTEEMKLAHSSASTLDDQFLLVDRFPLKDDMRGGGNTGEIFLWKYLGPLLEGENELPVVVPTADIKIDRRDGR